MRSKAGKPRGILNSESDTKTFTHNRYLPTGDLEFFVEHFWFVSWDLRDKKPHIQEVLPHPSVHIVFEKGRSRVVGVITGKFTRRLENRGRVFGIKFRPGAFFPFWNGSVSTLTDDILPINEVFDISPENEEKTVFSLGSRDKMMDYAEHLIRDKNPDRDQKITFINQIINRIKFSNEILKVDDIVDFYCISRRTLQRIFKQYVGINPKWIIMRYRLHEALDKLNENKHTNWSELALNLGYFDQAHFINDFKAMIGCSPTEYISLKY